MPAWSEPVTGTPPAGPAAAPDGELSMDGFSRWILPAVPAAPDRVPYVRRQAVAVLELWGLPDLLWVVELMLTELVANAVRHAGTPFTVVMSWNGRGLRCEVTDADPRPPRPQLVPDPEGTGGRGLLLVDRLAGSWGADLRRQGKTIWFEVRRS